MSKFSRRTFAPLSVSQNFLTNRRTILRLLGLTSIDNGDLVVEIGAGKGHITRELIKKSGKLITYEIDANLIGHLNRIFVGVENLEIRHMDFLKAALPRIPYKVFANIPFSRTSEIVRKLTSAQNPCGSLPPHKIHPTRHGSSWKRARQSGLLESPAKTPPRSA